MLDAPPAGIDGDLWRELTSALADSLESLNTLHNVQNVPLNAANRVRDLVATEHPEGGVMLSWTYRNKGDYDFNSEVNPADLTPIGMHFMENDEGENWFQAGVADGDENGEVNVADITPIGANFFNTVNGYVVETSPTPDEPSSWVEIGQVPLSEGKFTSDVEPKQVVIEARFVEITLDNEFSVRPYWDSGEGLELGIRSYDDGSVIDDSQLWNQVGGNAQHSGEIDVTITAIANRGRSTILAAPRILETTQTTDPFGNIFRGGPDGKVRKYNELDEFIWESEVGWPVDWLSYMVMQSLPALIAFHGNGLSKLNPDTGNVEQTDAVGAIAVPPILENPLGPGGSLAYATRDGVIRYHGLDSGFEPQWSTDSSVSVLSPLLRVSARYFYTAEELASQEQGIYSVNENGGDLSTVDSADLILGSLRAGLSSTFWANLGGLKLQSYNADGSKGSAIIPNDGEINDFDTSGQLIAVAAKTGIGGHKTWLWNVQLQMITGEHVHDSRVNKVAIDEEGVVSVEEDGDLNGFDLGMGVKFSERTAFVNAQPRLLITPKLRLTDGLSMEIRNRETGELEFSGGMVDQGTRLQFISSRDMAAGNGGAWHAGTLLDPGNTIVLSGLIRDGGEVTTVAPALSKIPLLGSLFASKAATSYKEELLVVITPRIIESLPAGRQASAQGDSGLALVDIDSREVDWDVTFDDPEVSAPAQVQGMYYVVSNDPGAGSGTLHAIDETQGTVEWEAPLGAPGITVPAVGNNRWVFVADADGDVCAFNAAGGEEWVQNYSGISTGLVIGSDNSVYFATADGMVYALDGATGGLDWSAPAGGPIGGSTPTIAQGGKLRLGTLGGDLIEIDPNDATPSATVLYSGHSPIVTQPISGSGDKTVLAYSDGWVICVDGAGSVVWTFNTGVPARIELSLAPNGNVYVGTAWGEIIELGQAP